MEKKYPIGEDKPLSPEMDLIYRIIEQFGNAIEMPNMEGWVKEYAAKQAIPQGAVWVKIAKPKLLGDYYCKCKVDGNEKRLIVEFDENGQWGEAAGYDCYEDFEIIEWLDESGQSEQPIKNT